MGSAFNAYPAPPYLYIAENAPLITDRFIVGMFFFQRRN